MTIDERLEKLAERVDAIAVTTENLQGMMHDLIAVQTSNEKRMGQVMELHTQLMNIVISHEDRITRLEDGK